AVLIFSAGLIIIIESFEKIITGVKIEKIEFGMFIMFFSMCMNIIVSKMLFKVAKEEDSLALEADAQHLLTDVYTTLGVFLGLVLIKILKLPILDPIIAILIALFIIKVSIEITLKAVDPLMDKQLPDNEIEIIKNLILSEPEVKAFHRLRTRKSGPQRQIDFHIQVVKSLHIDKAHRLTEILEEKIQQSLNNADVVIHVEPIEHTEK
ncbi:MAG: cation diffusion facilitator family transporter, partial [Elusimicrobia bacterium]|nr:cation diffusion facilitator family transporter [Elusimicrobiota bacterium]